MPNDPSSPQTNFQDNQNLDIDVKDMFQTFISGQTANTDNVAIDDLRSQININVTQQSGKKLLASLNISGNSTSGTANSTTPGQSVQESRCHAFYRIIGFPVIDSTKKRFYNPGFDIVKQTNADGTPKKRNISMQDKIDIAGSPIAGFEKLSFAREQYIINSAKIFSNPDSIDAGVFALTSGTYGSNGTVNIRPFSAPFAANKSIDPFDMNVIHQSYGLNKSGMYSLVGPVEVLLSQFQDANGDMPNQALLGSHLHIITPFIVDPRIDFSVYPMDSGTLSNTSKRVAVPFVPDETFLKASATATAHRPLLEKIIRERFSKSTTDADAGTAVQSVIDYIKAVKSIQDDFLVSQVSSGDVFKLSQQNSFAQYLAIIQSMMAKLVESLKIVHQAQGLYYYLPTPSKSGPEGGSSVRPVIVSPNISSNLVTTNDLNIIFKFAQSTLNNVIQAGSTNNSTPDVGGYAFSAFKLTFGSDSTTAYGDNSGQTLDNLTAIRDQQITKANQALQTVEMIMGEFSGFGLCDIIAIMGALYMIDKDLLIEFLDADSIDRMNQALGTTQTGKNNLEGAMQELAKLVNGFYNIMDQIFLDCLNNNSSNV